MACTSSVEPAKVLGKRKKEEDTDGLRQRIMQLVGEGALSKACASLMSQGLAPQDARTKELLQALHPSRNDMTEADRPHCVDCDEDEFMEFSPEEVEKALQSFPLGSAPVPTGLRPAHLTEGFTSYQSYLSSPF